MSAKKSFEPKKLDGADLASALQRILGAGSGEKIEIITPQFERPDQRRVKWVPRSADDLDRLRENATDDELVELCLGRWRDPDEEGNVLWLFPGEWYEHLPDGYTITTIFGKEEPFKRGETDDDIRFGCLPYGFVRRARKES